MKRQGKSEGPAKYVSLNGNITILTTKNNEAHGLDIEVCNDGINIKIYRKGGALMKMIMYPSGK